MFEKFFSNHPYALMALIITVFAAMMIAMFANTGEKTPVTCQQVSEVLDDLYYITQDSTEFYKQQNSNLKASVYADNGNVKFNFFEFTDDSDAQAMFNGAHSQIVEEGHEGINRWKAGYNNYTMYSTLSSDNVYYIVIRVGNTGIYAYCDYEYKSQLDSVLVTIDYGSTTKKK